MYEDNLTPLPPGDLAGVFADQLMEIKRQASAPHTQPVSPDSVVQWANRKVQAPLAAIARRLLLPGSGISGLDQLERLAKLAAEGRSCILCLNHRSNLDVPTLFALLADRARSEPFHRIVWIAGRKLEEDAGATRLMVQGINHVIISPPTWLKDDHSPEQLDDAHRVNAAAHRAIHEMRTRGWIFGLFPTATRLRENDESSAQAIEETDSYLKHFEYLLLGRIDGCTLPVSLDSDLTHEVPALDRVRYSFGEIVRTEPWRRDALRRYRGLDQRTASARAILDDIESIEPHTSGS